MTTIYKLFNDNVVLSQNRSTALKKYALRNIIAKLYYKILYAISNKKVVLKDESVFDLDVVINEAYR